MQVGKAHFLQINFFDGQHIRCNGKGVIGTPYQLLPTKSSKVMYPSVAQHAQATYSQRRMLVLVGAKKGSRVEDMDYKDLAKLRTSASEAQRRFLRLEQLVEVRRLYRNMHRAKYLLELNTPLLEVKTEESDQPNSNKAPSATKPTKTAQPSHKPQPKQQNKKQSAPNAKFPTTPQSSQPKKQNQPPAKKPSPPPKASTPSNNIPSNNIPLKNKSTPQSSSSRSIMNQQKSSKQSSSVHKETGEEHYSSKNGAGPSWATEESGEGTTVQRAGLDLEEDVQHVLLLVAEMHLTSEQIKYSVKTLRQMDLEDLFSEDKEVEETISKSEAVSQKLLDRAQDEVDKLPCSASVAWQAISSRNKPYLRNTSQLDIDDASSSGSSVSSNPIETLEFVEKSAEKFFNKKLKPAVARVRNKVQDQDVSTTVRSSIQSVKAFWDRLNGGGATRELQAPFNLPTPMAPYPSLLQISEALELQIQALERRVQDASKQRESQIRKSDLDGRIQMALKLRSMDNEVLSISRQLAVYTLQLQLEHVYQALQDEARDIGTDVVLQPLKRPGTSQDLELFIADFGNLDFSLAELGSELNDSISSTSAPPLPPSFDENLTQLATNIPDLRQRLGILDQQVYGGQGISVRRAQLIVREGTDKIAEGGSFFGRGLKLLASDLGYGVNLITKAVLGSSLKPREVSALRRTLLDLFSFVPFTIILVIPLTPLGHVLVFGFIQRYFPNLFPSQFSSRRQELMQRYEELRKQLLDARENAKQEEERMQLDRAAEVVARLTAPDLGQDGLLGGEGSNNLSPAYVKLRRLEVKVARAQRESYAADPEESEAEQQMQKAADKVM